MRIVLTVLALLFASPALAQQWGSYENARFGYVIEVPPGYLAAPEAENGDGRVFRSAEGTQLLRVYAGDNMDVDFEASLSAAMEFARAAGWALSYERVTPSWASFSGTRNGLVLYARAISICGGRQYASFELEYPERDISRMNPVVERLVASLRGTGDGAGC